MANKAAVKSNNTAVGILKSITIVVMEGGNPSRILCLDIYNINLFQSHKSDLVLFQCVDVKVLWCHEKDAG